MPDIISNPHKYFDQFIPDRDLLLLDLEQQAAQEGYHIVGPVVGELLTMLVKSINATKILELGTSVAYSTIYLANGLPEKGKVTTVEYGPLVAEMAKANIKKAGLATKIKVIFGEALCVMRELKGKFDLIFMDIDKEFYVKAIDDCHRLLRPGGMLIADNTALPESDPFNRAIADDPRWQSVNLFAHLPGHSPENDGILIALRK